MIKNTTTPLVAAVAAGLTALALGTATPVLASHETPNYKVGYEDGCWQGMFHAGHPVTPRQKTPTLANDSDYNNGWQIGYMTCYTMALERTHNPANPLMAPLPR